MNSSSTPCRIVTCASVAGILSMLPQWSIQGIRQTDRKLPTTLRTSPEGKFSCYVDAVEDIVWPSSYAGASAMQPRGDIKAQFVAW